MAYGTTRHTRTRPPLLQVRHVIDEVIQGQLTTVIMQTAHREADTSLLDYYAIGPKLQQLLRGELCTTFESVPTPTLEAIRSLETKLRVSAAFVSITLRPM